MLTKADVEGFWILDQQRKKLGREIDALEREQKALRDKIIQHVEANGGKDRTTIFQGFILALKTLAGTVAWKTAFVTQCGNAAAEKLIKAAPPRQSLDVQKAAA